MHRTISLLAALPVAASSAWAYDPDCCNTASGDVIGTMPVDQCLALPDHVPNDEDHADAASTCYESSSGGGGGSAEPIEFVENIPNGGFEHWETDSRPAGFASFEIPEGMPSQGIDFQTVFPSPIAHSGGTSLRITNTVLEIPGMPPGMPQMVIPGGTVTCEAGCTMITGQGTGSLSETQVPIAEPGPYVCGVYQGQFAGGDKLFVSVVTFKGSRPVGGTNAGDLGEAGAYLAENQSEWTPFRIPIVAQTGNEPADFDKATIELTFMPHGGVRSAMGGWNVNAGSDVLIDDLMFCGAQTDIDVWDAPVLERGEIDDAEELSVGAQTWVNYDNDDGDATFDNNPNEEGGVPEDDELVEVLLKYPDVPEAPGQVREGRLMVTGAGDDFVRIWTNNSKTEIFRERGDWYTLDRLLRPANDQLERHLFIEAVEGSRNPGDIVISWETRLQSAPDQIEKDEVAITALDLDIMEWDGRGNSEMADDTLLEDPHQPQTDTDKAVRVFPGARHLGDGRIGSANNFVDLAVVLNVKPVRPVPVHFLALDVDDPTADSDEVDNETTEQDNRGDTPAQTGAFVQTGSERVTVIFDEVNADIPFQVTMQPGDNFRVVASGDIDFLEHLANDDPTLARVGGTAGSTITDRRILAAEGNVAVATIRHPERYASPTLTVWRYFWTEIDRMAPVQNNFVQGNLRRVEAWTVEESTTIAGNRVVLDTNLADYLGNKPGNNGLRDAYRGGVMTVNGHEYRVVSNTNEPRGSGNDMVVIYPINGAPRLEDHRFEHGVGPAFHMIDDDEANGYGEGTAFQFPPPAAFDRTFNEAYMVAVNELTTQGALEEGHVVTPLPNPHDTVPYRANMGGDGPQDIRDLYQVDGVDYFDNHGLDNNPIFWTVYVFAGHQGATFEDGDGVNNAGAAKVLNGIADAEAGVPGSGTAALVLEEGVKERLQYEQAIRAALPASDPGKAIPTVFNWPESVAHEVGHLFGAEHGDGGLIDQVDMAPGRATFHPVSLDRIRRTKHP